MSDTQSLFHAVADLTPDERAHYYQENAIADGLRRQMEELLSHDAGTSTSLRDSIASEAQHWFQMQTATRQCGPYRLVRELGRGGMGAVYLAERADGEIEQHVAIKLLRPSAESPVWIDRFLRERQILASLRHPGITQLLDAGRTEDGQPYLVMEYVDGVPIDRYGEDLAVDQRLDLFLQVCEAVAYAHRNLIIHRDIKPSNILVSTTGVVKLLDFGIAKILDAATGTTRTRERLLTPEYASPEQVRGAAHSTATDIYSLGAVLYRLLTGRSPHVFGNASGESMEAAICTTDPTRASIVNAAVPRDLDFILAMALRKEPDARYRSVELLMEDVRAYLDHRPVHARGADPLYRMRRLLRRYWLPVSAVALAISGLATGLVIARQQKAVAEERFAQVRQAANRFIQLNDQLAQIPGATRIRESVISSSLGYLKALEGAAQTDPDLAAEVSAGYARVAEVQGVQSGSTAEQKTAEQTLGKSLRISEAAAARWPRHPGLLLAGLLATEQRMKLYAGQRRDGEALQQAARIEAIVARMRELGGPLPGHRNAATTALSNTSLTYLNAHLADDGIRVARLALEAGRGTTHHGAVLSLLASGLRLRGDLEQALETIRGARLGAEQANIGERTRRWDLYSVYWREGIILGEENAISLGRWKEAAAAFERSMAVIEPLIRQDAKDTNSRIRYATGARELGDVLAEREPARALAAYDAGLKTLSETARNQKIKLDEVRLLSGSTYALRKLGRAAEARKRIDTAAAQLAESRDYPAAKIKPGSEAYVVIRALADWEEAHGSRARAGVLYQELLAKMQSSGEDPKADLQYAVNYSGVHERLAKLAPVAEADTHRQARRDLWRHWSQRNPASTFIQQQAEAAK